MYLNYFIPLFLIFSSTNPVVIEQRTYDVFYKEKIIGILTATKKQQGGIAYYENTTSIDTRIIAKIQVDYNYEVKYKGSDMLEANALITLNGKQRTNAVTQKKDDGYVFVKNDDKPETLNEAIGYSTVKLIFEEPVNIRQVYAEEHGEFHTIGKTAGHTYEKKTPDGKVNMYMYSNGILQSAQIDGGVINFSIRLSSKKQ